MYSKQKNNTKTLLHQTTFFFAFSCGSLWSLCKTCLLCVFDYCAVSLATSKHQSLLKSIACIGARPLFQRHWFLEVFFPFILPVGIFKKSLRVISHEPNHPARLITT